MFTIAVINSKGGTGKTTVSTNLASYYQSQGYITALIDFDNQGSSSHWYKKRKACAQKEIELIQGFKIKPNMTREFQVTPKQGTEYCIIDFPSNLSLANYEYIFRNIDVVLIPMLCSPIDIHATTQFIHDLLLAGKCNRLTKCIGVVVNKADKTDDLSRFGAFIKSLKIPLVGSLNTDPLYSQYFFRGEGIFESTGVKSFKSNHSWSSIIAWLDQVEAQNTLRLKRLKRHVN